ncbi:MAG TPA: ABC transporter substrate-binding protein [Kofleriaceae bacterium]|nr:ABC transporter substrate-binding protein [Kofleriaceae bacterium]
MRRLALLAVLVGALGSAHGETRPRYGRKIVGSLLGQPASLDPVRARSHAEAQLATLLYDTLYRIGEEGEVVPHLAVDLPALSSDGREARVRIQKGAFFQDGSQLGAADVAQSLDRLSHSDAAWLMAPVASVSHDRDVLVLALRRATPELAEILAAPQTSITPGGRAPRRPNGSGPFAPARGVAKKPGLLLVAWERHFAGRPYADKLDLRWFDSASAEARAYEVGELLLSFRGPVAFTGHEPKYPTQSTAGPAVVMAYVGFGRGHGRAFDNRDLRRALSLAIGRDGLRSVGTGERVEPTPFPIAQDLGGPEPAAADLQARLTEARAALARATPRVKALSARTTWEVLVDRSRPDDREIAEKVVAALFRLGLTGKISELEAAALDGRLLRGDFDLHIGQLAPAGPSPALQIAGAFAAGGDGWAAAQMTSAPLAIDAALAAFAERLPVLPLFHRSIRVHHRVDVRRVAFDATGRLLYPDMFLFGGYTK